MTFEVLYEMHAPLLRHFVRQRIANPHDAEDVIQTIAVAALKSFPSLTDESRFKAWLLSVAAHKIKDYYTQQAKQQHVSLDVIADTQPEQSKDGDMILDVHQTIHSLPIHERQILRMHYLDGIPQVRIAQTLNIPLGTVKSRMSAGKRHFAQRYLPPEREVCMMKHPLFPTFGPAYDIIPSNEPVFNVICQETPGYLIIPKIGEKQRFAFYDDPDRHLTGVSSMHCVRKASIHGVDCVQIDICDEEENSASQRTVFVRLTDERCAYVAAMHQQDELFAFGSFLDEDWLESYRIGENNVGRRTHQYQRGEAILNGHALTVSESMLKTEDTDLLGRFTVRINGKNYDTVAMLTIEERSVMVIQYLDTNGRTVLFQRFNRADWKADKYGNWSEKLPHSPRMTMNGDLFIHWYDCIPEQVL